MNKRSTSLGGGRKLLGLGGIYAVVTVAPILLLLIVTPIVTRLVGAQDYGQIAVAITIYQFSSAIFTLGLPTAITRNAILEKGGFRHASGVVLQGSALSTVVALALFLTVPWWGGYMFPTVSEDVLRWGVLSGLGLGVVSLCQALMRAAMEAKRFVTIALISALLPPGIGLLLMLSAHPSPTLYTLGLATGYCLAGAGAIFITSRLFIPRLDWRSLRASLRIGVPTIPHLAAVPLLLTAALSLLTAHGDLEVAGQLQIAVMLGTSIVTIVNAVNNAWSPLILRTPPSQRGQVLKESTFTVSGLVLLLTICYVAVAPFLVPVIGGPLAESPQLLQASMIVLTSGVFHLLYLSNIHITFVTGRTGPLAFTTPLSAVLSLLLLLMSTNVLSGSQLLLWAALVWPAFYLIQALMSWGLARVSKLRPARIGISFVPLILSLLIVAQGLSWAWQPWGSIVTGLVSTAILVIVTLKLRDRRILEDEGYN